MARSPFSLGGAARGLCRAVAGGEGGRDLRDRQNVSGNTRAAIMQTAIAAAPAP
jgi:hypothetical protein